MDNEYNCLSDDERHRLLADLCMVAQGFHPSRKRTDELVEEGYVWVLVAKPPKHGLTKFGKWVLVSLASDESNLPCMPYDFWTRASITTPDYIAATLVLDQLEIQARACIQSPLSADKTDLLKRILVHQPSHAAKTD